MYAVIETGGKQYRVAEKDRLTVSRIEAKAGDSIQMGRVLMVADGDKITFGKPTLGTAKVTAKVLEQKRGQKLRIAKFRRRKGYFNRMGHRDELTILSIEKITI
jgi:large subunit ribosomal protein L21